MGLTNFLQFSIGYSHQQFCAINLFTGVLKVNRKLTMLTN